MKPSDLHHLNEPAALRLADESAKTAALPFQSVASGTVAAIRSQSHFGLWARHGCEHWKKFQLMRSFVWSCDRFMDFVRLNHGDRICSRFKRYDLDSCIRWADTFISHPRRKHTGDWHKMFQRMQDMRACVFRKRRGSNSGWLWLEGCDAKGVVNPYKQL